MRRLEAGFMPDLVRVGRESQLLRDARAQDIVEWDEPTRAWVLDPRSEEVADERVRTDQRVILPYTYRERIGANDHVEVQARGQKADGSPAYLVTPERYTVQGQPTLTDVDVQVKLRRWG